MDRRPHRGGTRGLAREGLEVRLERPTHPDAVLGFELLELRDIGEQCLPTRAEIEHLAFEPTKEKIKQYILVNRRQQRIEAMMAALRAKASIETYL